MMGSAVAYDLAAHHPAAEIVLADLDLERASRAARAIGVHVQAAQADVNNAEEVARVLQGCAVAISAVSYTVNAQITMIAIDLGVHLCDLGGNDDVVRQQLALDAEAKRRNVTIIPNCGLAPGLINILAMAGMEEFEAVSSIHLRVGGLPQHPRPPLGYQLVFSAEGLINEYIEKATIIQNGRMIHVEPLTGLEEIHFPEPFGALEAFHTSGGISLLPELLRGKVNDLDYKTIRYKGHCEKVKMLIDLGFASNEPVVLGSTVKTTREFFAELLGRKLDFGDTDVVLGRATIDGHAGDQHRTLAYDFIDYYDETLPMTAMMRGTAFPTSITALMVARGEVTVRGVHLPELCVPAETMIRELHTRGFHIAKKVTDARGV